MPGRYDPYATNIDQICRYYGPYVTIHVGPSIETIQDFWAKFNARYKLWRPRVRIEQADPGKVPVTHFVKEKF